MTERDAHLTFDATQEFSPSVLLAKGYSVEQFIQSSDASSYRQSIIEPLTVPLGLKGRINPLTKALLGIRQLEIALRGLVADVGYTGIKNEQDKEFLITAMQSRFQEAIQLIRKVKVTATGVQQPDELPVVNESPSI